MNRRAARTWSFSNFAENLSSAHGEYLRQAGKANRSVSTLARMQANGKEEVNLDDDWEVGSLSKKCDEAKDDLNGLKEAVSKVLFAVEEYQDEVLFRQRHSGVVVRGSMSRQAVAKELVAVAKELMANRQAKIRVTDDKVALSRYGDVYPRNDYARQHAGKVYHAEIKSDGWAYPNDVSTKFPPNLFEEI